MDPTAALLAGLAAGLVIAMQVGAVSLLLVEAALVAGPRAGVAAGMGVATADLGFAIVAVAVGGTAGAVLANHQAEIRLVAGCVLAAIAVHGLVALRADVTAAADQQAAPAHRSTPETFGGHSVASHYIRFLAVTGANPLTIASFAAVAASLSLPGLAAGVTFAAGVGLASAGWHLVLSLAAGHAGRWLTAGMRRGLAIAGRVAVLAIAAHLALSA